MAIELIPLNEIDDSPFQCRQHYSTKAIDELAASISEHGLRQKPEARRKEGRVQLAYGHMRFRAFKKLAKTQPAKWKEMPLDIQEISDENMFYYSLEENMRRADITPLEIAQSVEVYLTQFPEQTETQLSKRLKMSQGHISNMRRVLRLPDKVLAKINEGKINFTMGRELLVFQGKNAGQYQEWRGQEPVVLQKDEGYLMLEAIRGIGGNFGIPATVDGIIKQINTVASQHFRAVGPGQSWGQREPLFDTKESDCLKCEHTIATHPTKGSTYYWCTDLECWDRKQQAHKDEVATNARAKMQEDILQRVNDAEANRQKGNVISQEISTVDDEGHSTALTPEEANTLEEIIEAEEDRELAGSSDDEEESPPEDGGVIPDALRILAEEKAGTRAEVLDLHDLKIGTWGDDLKQGYVLLRTDILHDPDECLNRCTAGFHYAFNSRTTSGEVQFVCTGLKCHGKKKGALTREKNAAGQNKKKAELAAIKEAVQNTTVIDVSRIKLILVAQCQGGHIQRSYHSQDTTSPAEWFINELSLEVGPGKHFTAKILSDKIDSMEEAAVAQLLVKFMLETLLYRGDIDHYKIQTTEALNWMGVGVNIEKKKNDAQKKEKVPTN